MLNKLAFYVGKIKFEILKPTPIRNLNLKNIIFGQNPKVQTLKVKSRLGKASRRKK